MVRGNVTIKLQYDCLILCITVCILAGMSHFVRQAAPMRVVPPTSAVEEVAQQVRDRLGIVSDVQFAATILVSMYTTQRWRAQGLGPRFMRLGQGIFYRLKDIEQWMDENIHANTETFSRTGQVTGLVARDIEADDLQDMIEAAPATGRVLSDELPT